MRVGELAVESLRRGSQEPWWQELLEYERLHFISVDLDKKRADARFPISAPLVMSLGFANQVASSIDGERILMKSFQDERMVVVLDRNGKMLASWIPHPRQSVEQIAVHPDGQEISASVAKSPPSERSW